MQIPLVDLKAQYASIKPEVDEAIQRVLNHTQFSLGREAAKFKAADVGPGCVQVKVLHLLN